MGVFRGRAGQGEVLGPGVGINGPVLERQVVGVVRVEEGELELAPHPAGCLDVHVVLAEVGAVNVEMVLVRIVAEVAAAEKAGDYAVVLVEVRALVVEAEGPAAEEDTSGEGSIVFAVRIGGENEAK